MHSTNYYDTLIEIAEDCPVSTGDMPPIKGDKKTVANYQFEMIFENPYKYTSDEILFAVLAIRKEFRDDELDEQRQHFFSKGQPCFRASPLTKRYGWGVHADSKGRLALFGVNSKEYNALQKDAKVKKVKAMKSKRG
jgi:hypothetical protein